MRRRVRLPSWLRVVLAVLVVAGSYATAQAVAALALWLELR